MNSKRYFLLIISTIMIFALILSGCSDSPSSEQTEGQGNEVQTVELGIGASQTGGAMYRWVVAVSNLVNETTDVVDINPVTTLGSTENVNLIASGEMQLGTVGSMPTYLALKGMADWEGNPQKDMRLVYALYPDYWYVCVPRDSDINVFSDLKGKRVNLDVMGGGANTAATLLLETLGWDPETSFQPMYLSANEAVSAIQEGNCDAHFVYGAPGITAMLELASSSKGIKVISLNDEEISTITEKVPAMRAATMAAGSYPGVGEVTTVGGYSALAVHKDIPEELVYEIVKILNERHDRLVEVTPLAAESTVENTVKMAGDGINTLALHPGAERYLKEIGAL